MIYLGADLSLDHLHLTLEHTRPRLLLLSASRPETTHALAGVAPLLAGLVTPRPCFAFGGRAFDQRPDLAASIEGTYLPGAGGCQTSPSGPSSAAGTSVRA